MEPEVGVLLFDLVPFDDFSDSGENVNDLDLGRDALIEFVRQLPDYFWRRHRGYPPTGFYDACPRNFDYGGMFLNSGPGCWWTTIRWRKEHQNENDHRDSRRGQETR